MRTTAESSGPSAVELERRLGSLMYAQIAPVFIEVAQYRAERAKAEQRGLHAGAARAARTRLAITAMAEARSLQLAHWTDSHRSKCIWLQGQIKIAIRDNNGMWNNITRTPHWTTIDRVIKGLHDVSTQ